MSRLLRQLQNQGIFMDAYQKNKFRRALPEEVLHFIEDKTISAVVSGFSEIVDIG